MNILNLVQGTKEWLETRLSHFTASEAPAMMGVSKYMTRNELLDLKKSGITKPISEFQQKLFNKGHAAEESARLIIENNIGEELYPATGSLEIDGLPLLASFDGIDMLETIIFEHKLFNQTLFDNVQNDVLEPMYYWQLEHQLLVSNADKAIFTCSDGTEENMASMTYTSQPERREQLIAGWKQFQADLVNHEVKAKAEKVVATETDSFPMITFEVTGTEISSNASHVLEAIKDRIAVELSKKLETDQDFADAKALVKQVKKARETLKTLDKKAQDEFASYRDFSLVLNEMDSVLQKFGSTREKEIKAAEQNKKELIVTEASIELDKLLASMQKELNGIAITVDFDFKGAIKNKRTIESIHNAVDSELARCKIIANEKAAKIRANIKSLEELAINHQYLFNDRAILVSTKANDDLVNLIKSRIADHEAEEAERKAAELARIEAQAKEKAEREAQAKLEAEREKIRREEAKKAKAIAEHEEQLQAERPEFCGREFISQEPLEPLPLPEKEKQPSLDDIHAFLVSAQESTLNDIGYLLLSGDKQLEAEALNKIKVAFAHYMQKLAA